MDNKDYYALLGIHVSADADTIKTAYRRAARKYHPDVSHERNAEEIFKSINEAYEILSNPLKREKFDRAYRAWQIEQEEFTVHQRNAQSQTPHHPNTQSSQAFSAPKGKFSSLLDALFGSPKNPPKRANRKTGKPTSSIAAIRLTLEDIYLGSTKTIRLPSGENIQIKIPQGIEDGKKIRLPGRGLQKTDLHLKIQLLEHPLFKLQEQDLHLTLPIAPWEAALGSKITIPGLGGPLQLTIPSNTVGGQKLRLKGQGMQHPEKTGDLIVTIHIETPPIQSTQERDFYLQMAQQFNWTPRAHF